MDVAHSFNKLALESQFAHNIILLSGFHLSNDKSGLSRLAHELHIHIGGMYVIKVISLMKYFSCEINDTAVNRNFKINDGSLKLKHPQITILFCGTFCEKEKRQSGIFFKKEKRRKIEKTARG